MSEKLFADVRPTDPSSHPAPLTIMQWGALYRTLPMRVIASCMWEVNSSADVAARDDNRDAVIAQHLEAAARRQA